MTSDYTYDGITGVKDVDGAQSKLEHQPVHSGIFRGVP